MKIEKKEGKFEKNAANKVTYCYIHIRTHLIICAFSFGLHLVRSRACVLLFVFLYTRYTLVYVYACALLY